MLSKIENRMGWGVIKDNLKNIKNLYGLNEIVFVAKPASKISQTLYNLTKLIIGSTESRKMESERPRRFQTAEQRNRM